MVRRNVPYFYFIFLQLNLEQADLRHEVIQAKPYNARWCCRCVCIGKLTVNSSNLSVLINMFTYKWVFYSSILTKKLFTYAHLFLYVQGRGKQRQQQQQQHVFTRRDKQCICIDVTCGVNTICYDADIHNTQRRIFPS